MKFKTVSQDSRSFLKIKAGEPIKGVFRGDVFDYRSHWKDNRSIICLKEECELCKLGDKSRFRFRINFIVKEDDNYVAKIWDQGIGVYRQLASLNEEGELERYTVKITRSGSGKDTEYTVVPLPNGMVGAELEEKLSQVKLNDLGHIAPLEKEPPPIPESDDLDIPF